MNDHGAQEAELMADKERLDWLESLKPMLTPDFMPTEWRIEWGSDSPKFRGPSLRAAIDAARGANESGQNRAIPARSPLPGGRQ